DEAVPAPLPAPHPAVTSDLAEAATSEVAKMAQTSDVKDTHAEIARSLYFACRHRGFPVDEPDLKAIVVGSSLIAIPMALRAGASIRPIEASVDDLAREVGVPSVSVENDPRPFHVRFLVGRRDREFPQLPTQAAPLVEPESQSYLGLYLGRTIEGQDFASFVSSWPHMLIAGTTGSGKTTFLRSMLRQLTSFDPTFLQLAVV